MYGRWAKNGIFCQVVLLACFLLEVTGKSFERRGGCTPKDPSLRSDGASVAPGQSPLPTLEEVLLRQGAAGAGGRRSTSSDTEICRWIAVEKKSKALGNVSV